MLIACECKYNSRTSEQFKKLFFLKVIGEGNKRFVTLSHAAQIRRFTSDLLRILKSRVAKQVMLSEFASAYEKILFRPFDPVDYGLCDIEDLLEELSENIIVMKNIENDIYIGIPKKEQTPEEVMRTKKFAIEVSCSRYRGFSLISRAFRW